MLDDRRLDLLLEGLVGSGTVPASAICVFSGESSYTRCLGKANVEEDINATVTTRFPVGCVVKSISALMLVWLSQSRVQNFALNTPIVEYLPELSRAKDNRVASITTTHLLTHSSGIDDRLFDLQQRGVTTLDAVCEWLCDKELLFDSGKFFSYCNVAYLVSGLLIERLTGRLWEDVVRAFFGIPSPCAAQINAAVCYRQRTPDSSYSSCEVALPLVLTPSAGCDFILSIEEMAKILEVFHNPDILIERHGFSKSSIAYLFSDYHFGSAIRSPIVGLGWRAYGGTAIFQTSEHPCYQSAIILDHARSISCTYLGNGFSQEVLYRIYMSIFMLVDSSSEVRASSQEAKKVKGEAETSKTEIEAFVGAYHGNDIELQIRLISGYLYIENLVRYEVATGRKRAVSASRLLLRRLSETTFSLADAELELWVGHSVRKLTFVIESGRVTNLFLSRVMIKKAQSA